MATKKRTGFILWRGPSRIDGAPIVAIATFRSRNVKTGDMVQTWILREDISPVDAANSGGDRSVCGDCKHRGRIEEGRNVGRSCYVTLFRAPLSVWRSYKRGVYGEAPVSAREARALLAGRTVRLGAYGDPAAINAGFWQFIIAEAKGHTGYTHQWATSAESFASVLMASADSEEERLAARAAGYRVFRVRREGEALAQGEAMCPASAEAGHKTSCLDCKACGGLAAKAKCDIAILVHGARGKHFQEART
jgi:hypothetical protein